MTNKPAFPLLKPRSSSVFVGRDDRGVWVIRDQDCLRGGLFISQAEARRYALIETGNCLDAIKYVPGTLDLTFG
jgi:hypothetical protein